MEIKIYGRKIKVTFRALKIKLMSVILEQLATIGNKITSIYLRRKPRSES